MRSILFSLLAFCALPFAMPVLRAQAPAALSSAQLYQSIQKLKVLGSVLYIAAHPDDENTRLIAYLSKDRLYRTGYLSLTRGDGGQNLIGEEQGVELGMIRTQELLAARRVDGGEQFFTRAYDFGYSKTPAETFAKWDREKILSDVVWIIRRFRPDVIIARFPTTGEGGHGHHTASAMLASEAFAAAADPARFAEQLRWVAPWQAKRLLWNTFNFGTNNTIRDDQFKIDVGGFNPLLGKSYGELAAESRSQHKSQGFGVPASRGEAFEYFKTLAGEAPVKELMDGVVTQWDRVPGGMAIETTIDSVLQSYDFRAPQRSLNGLLRIDRQLRQLPDGYWKDQKLKELQALLLPMAGIFADAFTQQPVAIRGDSLKISVNLVNRMGVEANLVSLQWPDRDTILAVSLAANRSVTFNRPVVIASDAPLTQPYWLVAPMKEGYFDVQDPLLIGEPENKAAYYCRVRLQVAGQSLEISLPVRYKFTDPVKGELYWPLVVSPAVLLQPQESLQLVYADKKTQEGSVLVSTLVPARSLQLQAMHSVKGSDKPVFMPDTLQLSRRDQSASLAYTMSSQTKEGIIALEARDQDQHRFDRFRIDIRYDHIPAISYFKPSQLTVKKLSIETRGKKIGYINGAGDKIPEALARMGFEVILLGEKDITPAQLKQCDAIITGVRAYNTHEWLNKVYDRLMQYVQQGGNLIVQYNTSNQIGPVKAQIGPYPFNITRNRITDETATVTLSDPRHPLFTFPNNITQEDFAGWVQERSIYHAASAAPGYEYLIKMSDPGEKEEDGSLIVARYGKGWFTYTGLALFRELPAGVTGAYRLLANLIALNQQDKHGF